MVSSSIGNWPVQAGRNLRSINFACSTARRVRTPEAGRSLQPSRAWPRDDGHWVGRESAYESAWACIGKKHLEILRDIRRTVVLMLFYALCVPPRLERLRSMFQAVR